MHEFFTSHYSILLAGVSDSQLRAWSLLKVSHTNTSIFMRYTLSALVMLCHLPSPILTSAQHKDLMIDPTLAASVLFILKSKG
jgi:hypothetical protein